MHAAENDCVELTKKILELNEFPIDQVDAHGNTALNLLAQHHTNPHDASLFLAFVTHGADPTLRNHFGSNAIMSAENNKLKGIASDLKDTVQSASWQHPEPSAPPMTNPEPSAPPMPMSEDANGLDNVEAQQPPQRYYEHGLFGGSALVSVPPQQENRDVSQLSNSRK
jgi:ankyrin repeat protein